MSIVETLIVCVTIYACAVKICDAFGDNDP